MAEFKETVTTSEDQGVDETGAKVQQRTRKIDTEVSANGKSTAANAIWYVVGLIEVLLGFRFALKLFGANPSSGFVEIIYNITNVLTAPFDNIFGVTRQETGEIQSVFEPSILVAAIVYALLGWGLVKLLNVNKSA